MRGPAVAATALCLFLWAGTAVAVACSCVKLDPRTRLADGDPAIVAVVVSARPVPGFRPASVPSRYVYRLHVERAFNVRAGRMLSVTGHRSSASCGFTWSPGDRVAAFLHGREGTWEASLCSLLTPRQLYRAAGSTPVGKPRRPVLHTAAVSAILPLQWGCAKLADTAAGKRGS